MLTLEQFRDKMEGIAQKETGAHFGPDFRTEELGEGERTIHEHFRGVNWLDPVDVELLLAEIKNQEAEILNPSQKLFYHYLRNQFQIKMIESQ